MITHLRYNVLVVLSICIRYVLACNAQIYHPARPVRWPPHGTATFEGGVLGKAFLRYVRTFERHQSDVWPILAISTQHGKCSPPGRLAGVLNPSKVNSTRLKGHLYPSGRSTLPVWEVNSTRPGGQLYVGGGGVI
eukprot:COSAG01_NODE_1419_length_10368_cov_131.656344_2_plen_135_part_00